MRVRMTLQVPLRMPTQGVDAVGDQAAGEGVDDRDAAAAAGLEGDAGVVLAGEGEQLRPAGGEQALVGGDDGLAEPQGPLDVARRRRSVPPISSTTICRPRVVDGGVGVGGEGQAGVRRGVLRRVADDDVAEVEPQPGAALRAGRAAR